MKELKCPNCGSIFSVDEADYATIVNQVRNEEFKSEVERRVKEMCAQMEADHKITEVKSESAFRQMISDKDRLLTEKDAAILQLQQQLKSIGQIKEAEKQIAVRDEQTRSTNAMAEKNAKIAALISAGELAKSQAIVRENGIKQDYENRIKLLQEQVDYYKDLKTRMSTKMIGETLETHCSTLFNQMLRPIMPDAYFEKDNDASEGSKGDFIFRDSEDGVEYISIMFEMKNEMDTTATKHKNEDFFKKLDEDRKKKSCEFAVLVSLLEPDSELYNGGIVDVSYRYDKMYVIRPQFFIPIIALLVQTSKKSLEYKKQLQIAMSKDVDVTNFENKLEEFRAKFGKHYTFASDKFEAAIKQIDDSISKLQKVKENLLSSENYLRLSYQDTEDLTIRKLTYKNPTMKSKFEEARTKGHKASPEDQAS